MDPNNLPSRLCLLGTGHGALERERERKIQELDQPHGDTNRVNQTTLQVPCFLYVHENDMVIGAGYPTIGSLTTSSGQGGGIAAMLAD